MKQDDRSLKVGQLAKLSGVSIRTLHHYDEIGLLSPSMRSDSGHRFYSVEDVLRFQQIMSLRSLGFSLEQIREFLDEPQSSPLMVLEMHLSSLKKEIEERTELLDNLRKITTGLRSGENPTVAELLKLIEGTAMIQKYYTQDQLDQLADRGRMLGDDKIQEVQNEWVVLIEEVRKEMSNGTDPESDRVKRLAERWQALIEMFTGGDPGISSSLANMYRAEGPSKASQGFVDEDVCVYIGKAFKKEGA